MAKHSIAWRAFVRDWRHFRLHWITTVLGIGIAVAIVSAVHISIDKTRAAIERNHADLNEGASVTVESVSGWLPEGLYAAAVLERRIDAFEPVVEAWVTVGNAGDRYLLLGVDLLAHSNLSRAGESQALGASVFTRLMTTPGAVAVGPALLAEQGAAPDSLLSLRYGDRQTQARVATEIEASFAADHPVFERLIVADIATAQELLGVQGYLSYLKVHGFDSADVQARVRDFVAEHRAELTLVSQEQRLAEASSLPQAFYANIQIIGWLALLLGTMIALNATLYVVRLRKNVVGTLRALGVTGGEILLLQGGSFLVTASIGSALGLVLGVLASDALYVLTLRTVNELFYPTTWVDESLTASTLLKALAVGMGAGMAGAVFSAWQAWAIAPVTLMRERIGPPRSPAWRWSAAVLLIVGSLAGLLQGTTAFFGVHAALFGLLGGFVLLCPDVIVGAASVLAAVVAKFVNPLSLWGLRNIGRLKRFYALAMASLVVAVSVAMALQVMVASFRVAVDQWISQGFNADYYLSFSSPLPGQAFSSADVQGLRALPGVAAVVASSRVALTFRGAEITAFAREDFAQIPQRFSVVEMKGDIAAQDNGVLVTEAFAFYYSVRVGDVMALSRGDVSHDFVVSGIVRDYSSGKGYVMAAPAALQRLLPVLPTTALAVYLAAGEADRPSAESLAKAVSSQGGVRVRDSQFIRTFTLDVFDRTFEIITVLSFVVIATSCLGVMIALFTAQTEKQQDYRILRMIGVTPREIGGLIYREVSVIAVLSSLAAVPLAYLLAYFFCHKLMKQSFGWSFPLQTDVIGFASVFVLAIAGSLLAGALVARHFASSRASKHVDVLSAPHHNWRTLRTIAGHGYGRKAGWLALGLGGVAVLGLFLTLRAPSPLSSSQRAQPSFMQAMQMSGFAPVVAPREFLFPYDHGPHPEQRVEWWYYTGNVQSDAGRRFGFQITLFRVGLVDDGRPEAASAWRAKEIYIGHAALTDIDGHRYYFEERFERAALALAGAQSQPNTVWLRDWEVTLADGAEFFARIDAAEFSLELSMNAEKPPVLQGEQGLSRKGPGAGEASYYYSIPRLGVRGTVMADGAAHRVTGGAWLDREWTGAVLARGLEGWDWFGLQFSSGEELMLYRLRDQRGGASPWSGGSWVDKSGAAVVLAAGDMVLRPATGSLADTHESYPLNWEIDVAPLGLRLVTRAAVDNQEFNGFVRYWEGAVTVDGSRRGEAIDGVGYMELTGY